MPMGMIFDTISDFTEKFKQFFQQRKKVAALSNLAEVGNFEHKNYLRLIKACMQDGFLGKHEADFLDYMLSNYELNYLDWSHKTKWLKRRMREMAEETGRKKEREPIPQMFFDFDKKPSYPRVPTEVLATTNAQPSARI